MGLSPILLPVLALSVPALLVLASVGVARPRLGAEVAVGTLAVSGLGALVAFVALLGAGAGQMVLPVGVPAAPSAGLVLALDGLSGFFLLLLFLSSAAASLAALDGAAKRPLPAFPVLVAGLALTLLAGDGFGLLFGLLLSALATWGLVLDRPEPAARDAALPQLGIAVLGAFLVLVGLVLLSRAPGSISPDLPFAALRAAAAQAPPPVGWRAGLGLLLVVVGAGGQAGLAPLHPWLSPTCHAAPVPVAALLSGAATKVALYVLIRILFDLAGPATPLWWAVPLLLLGTATAVLGAARALMERDLTGVLAGFTIQITGLLVVGLGVALAGRGTDLPALTAMALGAVLLHALALGLGTTLLFLAAGAVQRGADTQLLHRLGGLAHRMPWTAGCVLAGAMGLAVLPPGPGFAGLWLLLQAILSATRVGGLPMQILLTVVLASVALASALGTAAAVRLVGVAFLGRPRTPRTAAAEEAPRHSRNAMAGLAAVAVLVGLVPGLVLRLAGGALQPLAGVSLSDRAGLFAVAPQVEAPGYLPLALVLLLGALAAGVFALLRARAARGERRESAWDGGFAAPPPWLPFGDPATQYGAASFSQILQRVVARPVLGGDGAGDGPLSDPGTRLFAAIARVRAAASARLDRVEGLNLRRMLALVFGALVLFLAVVAWLEAP